MLKNIGKLGSEMFSKVGFWTKKNTPELLIAASIVAAAGSIVLAVKATMKLEPVAKRGAEKINKIKEKIKDESKLASGEYNVQVLKKELFAQYTKTSWDITKLYIPSAISFGLFVAGILSSHKVMKGRNFALASAYSLAENSFRDYRERVKNKFGSDVENDLYKNVYEDEQTVTEKDEEGNDIDVVKKVKTYHMSNTESASSYLFDESNPEWEKNTILNIELLLGRERYLNQKLVAQGYLFLSDVYESLGVYPSQVGERKTQASRVLGWLYDPNDDTLQNHISFGLADKMGNLNSETMEIVRSGQRNFWLEFNPDGDILTGDKLGKTFMKYAKG